MTSCFRETHSRIMFSFLMATLCVLCIYTILFCSCATVFVRVKTLNTEVMDKTTVNSCAMECLQTINGTSFCFGFTIEPDDSCKVNNLTAQDANQRGAYYKLVDYRNTGERRQCGDTEGAMSIIDEPRDSTFTSRIFNGSLLLFQSIETTGTECRKTCGALRMYPTSIHSKEENEFIRSTVCALYYPTSKTCGVSILHGHICHVGIDLDENTRTWKFSDGTTYNEIGLGEFSFNDDAGTPERCAEMYREARWNDVPCDALPSHCICRKWF